MTDERRFEATPPEDEPTGLENILARVERKEISLRLGEEQAGTLDLADPSELRGVDDVVRRVTTKARTDGLRARPPARVLAAAFDTPEPPSGLEHQWANALLAWVEVAGRSLEDAPDGRDQRHAHARGERVRAWAESHDIRSIRARACEAIASLHLRPYASPSRFGYADLPQIRWQSQMMLVTDQRMGLELMSQESLDYPTNTMRLLPWERAAWTAEAHLREGLAVAPPGYRMSILMTLVRLLDSLRREGRQIDVDELRSLVVEGSGTTTHLAHLGVLAVAARLNAPIPEATWITVADGVQLDLAVDAWGARDSCRVWLEVLAAIEDIDPRRALAMAMRLTTLAIETGDENLQEALWLREVRALALDIRSRKRGRWFGGSDVTAEERAILSAVKSASKGNSPGEVADTLSALVPTPGARWSLHGRALEWLRITSSLQYALSLSRGERLRRLPRLLLELLDLGLLQHVGALMGSLLADLFEMSPEDSASFAALVEEVSLSFERALGPEAPGLVREIAIWVMAAIGRDQENLDQVVRFVQAVSGLRFATALEGHAGSRSSSDQEGGDLLAAIRRAERQLLGDRVAFATGSYEADLAKLGLELEFLDDVLVTSYVTTSELYSGRSPEAATQNLRIQADALLERRLLTADGVEAAPTLGVNELRAALSSRSVLLLTFVGRADPPRGAPQIVTILVHRRALVSSAVTWESSSGDAAFLEDSEGEAIWVTSDAGLLAATLRAGIQEYCRPDVMSLRAEELFRDHGRIEDFIGAEVLEVLRDLRRHGVDHLCVVPYGPLRVLPLHLLGAPDHCLADDWTVTYLNHPTQLKRDRPVKRRDRELSSFGVAYTDVGHDVGQLMADETTHLAQDVASSFGTGAVIEHDATPAAVVAALETSRYVHIAAHGFMNANAPMFQNVLLSDGHGGAARLEAHELLGLDLVGLELVTLSACASALTRFDMADNPRGFSPALQLSGAQAVVGCLWPVKAAAAGTFFPALFEELAGGASLLDAYSRATRRTRSAHPELRDWGAFYLTGDWRQSSEGGPHAD